MHTHTYAHHVQHARTHARAHTHTRTHTHTYRIAQILVKETDIIWQLLSLRRAHVDTQDLIAQVVLGLLSLA